MDQNIRFNQDDRQRYYNETLESLNALLQDALAGEDQNEIKPAFPPNCGLDDIQIESSKTSLNYINNESTPIIEVIIQISYNKEVIGEYTSEYSIDGELVDEAFYLD